MPALTAATRIAVIAALALSAVGARSTERVAGETARAERIAQIRDMRAPRAAHTATTLADGRVLVAGGFTNATSPHAAELFDPVAATYLPVRMQRPRHSHTATRLADGRVLIVGGYTHGGDVTGHAEVFDPSRGQFDAVGTLMTARAGHVAVPLADGRVLIVGGVGDGWTFLSSAEMFDPRSNRFTPAAPMGTARESHVGVRLTDGRVIIIGGHEGRRSSIRLHASTEIYDPVRNRFEPGPTMQRRRHKHDAVLLPDGRVFVTGGSDERDDQGAYTFTELLDPGARAFGPGPELLRARYKHAGTTIVLPDGDVLLAGGDGRAERHDLARGVRAPVAADALLSGQFSATTLLRDGRVLITGGYGSGTGPRASTWMYSADH